MTMQAESAPLANPNVGGMNEDELRDKLCGIMGWIKPPPLSTLCGWTDAKGIAMLSDPLLDLNAIAEAEKKMFAGYHGAYFANLGMIIGQAIQPTGWYDAYLLGTTTARQRAEALVATLSVKRRGGTGDVRSSAIVATQESKGSPNEPAARKEKE